MSVGPSLDDVRKAAAMVDHVLYDTGVLLTLVCLYAGVEPTRWKAVERDGPHVAVVLTAILAADPSPLVLPTILTEVSHFIEHAPSHLQRDLFQGLRIAASKTERHTPSKTLAANPLLELLGFADVDVLHQGDALVLTIDNDLLNRRLANGLPTLDPRTVQL